MTKKILTCVFSLFFSVPCVFAGEVGTITYVEGRVDVSKQGSGIAVPVRCGEQISIGDAIRTKSDSKAEVIFLDKSKLRMAQNSRVEVTDYQLGKDNKRKTATIKLDRGKVRTIIAKMSDAAEFNIVTPNAEGKVKGSDIFAFYQAGSSGMLVAEGNLLLKSLANPEKSLTVTPGNSALVSIEGLATGPRPYLELEKKMSEQETSVPPSAAKKSETVVIKGMFAKISGAVKVTNQGMPVPHKASYGEVLGEGDSVETGDDGFCELRFDNGCSLTLKPNTQLVITKLVIDPKTGEYQNLFEASKGKIKARIENLKGKSTFEIKTPAAICGARGTIMYLEITPTMVKAFFEGGNGYINNLISGAQTNIDIGHNGSADNQGNNANPVSTSNEERDNWTQGWDSDNGTSGYSSPGSNDNTGNLGDNTGGNNNAGNTNNDNGGTGNNNNGNPDVYIPPENSNPTPTPPTFLFGAFDTFNNTLSFGPDNSLIVNGNFTNPSNYSLWSGRLDVTFSDGTRVWGGIGGTDINNSLEGLLYGIYITETGETGYIKLSDGTDNLNGSFDSLLGTFQASGMVTAYYKGTTTISPEDLYYGSSSVNTGTISGKVGGDFSGAMRGETFSLDENTGAGPLYWGVWRTEGRGTYAAGSMSSSWKTIAGGRDNSEHGDGYWITNIDGKNWSGGALDGTTRGMILNYSTSGPLSDYSLGIISGNILGTYGFGSWQALSCGTFDETPLTFGGNTTHESGVDYAIFGGTKPLWTGSPGILFIGDYSAQGAPSQELWGFHTLGKTSDGAIYGMAGGTKLGNVLKGLMYAIYIRPDPEHEGQYLTGYLNSTDISGSVYPDLGAAGMFEADGNVTATEMGKTTVSPSQLLEYMQNDVLNNGAGPIYRDEFNGKIGGDVAGTFNGESISIRGDSYTDQMWSIWRTEASGTYQLKPQGAWHAVLGGHDTESGDTGYFIGHINGPAWSASEFSGNITGKEIWYSPDHFYISTLGSMTGETIGTCAGGAWEAISAGVTNDVSLAFGGDTTHESGVDYALFGGTQSLWTGSPDILFMGDYSAKGAPSQELWKFHTLGTTSDSAAIYGMSGGIKLNNVLKGLMYAIYIRPDSGSSTGYSCGYMKSTDISGDVYPDLGETGMFESDGTVVTTKMGETTVSPGDLIAYMQNDVWNDSTGGIYRDGFNGKVGGDIITGAFSGESISICGDSFIDQMWSIWRTELSGTCSLEPQSDWSAVFGGSDTDQGDKGYFLGHINGSAWSGNEFSANVTGKEIWYNPSKFSNSTMGYTTGEMVGIYAAGEWEAINAGITEEVSLAFGGEISGNFGYYDFDEQSLILDNANTSVNALLGGTGSLWTGTPLLTIIGEFSSGDYRLWATEDDITGKTSDGASLSGIIGGTKLDDNSLKGMFYAFYVKPDGECGYLKSTDISGYFYPDISMFEADGTITATGMGTTDILPENLSSNINNGNETILGSVGGALSGEMEFGHASIEGQNWGLWKGSLGGSAHSGLSDNWSAVAGGKDVSGNDTFYWLTNIDGASTGTNELSATISGTALDYDPVENVGYLTVISDGTLLGVYDENGWEALAAGAYTEALLAFGGESPKSQFGCPDPANNGEEFESGSLSYLFGGTSSPWDDTAQMTIIGEFTGSDDCKFWDNEQPLTGYTSDGAVFYTGVHGYLGGIVGTDTKDSSKALFYAFYIRPDSSSPTGNSCGYIKSTDLSGNFYSSINMFKLQGTVAHYLDLPTTLSPEDLDANLKQVEGESHGLVSGAGFSGTTRSESAYIDGQNWGLWIGSTGGTYSNIPASNQMVVGGYAENALEEKNAYWIGEGSGGSWQNNEISGTISGTTITTDSLQTFSGDTIGAYGDGNWQALNVGAWTATALKFVSSISSSISGSEASLDGLFGSTESPWSGNETAFTLIGSCSVSDGKYHIWGTDLESHNYYDGTNTTYDGGAYYGMIGGTFKDNMDGGLIAIYIDKDGNAGILSGSLTGSIYADIDMCKADGTLRATQKVSGLTIPADLRDSLNELNMEGNSEGIGGGFEIISGGTITGGITRKDSTVFNIPGQGWGIWGATMTGAYANLTTEPTSWRLGLGGESFTAVYDGGGGELASCWLGTLDASVAEDSKLTGNFKGFFFSDAGDNLIKVAAISGNAAGYVDVAEGNGTWQAGAIGEWVEVNQLLDVGQVGFTMTELQNFVSIPITEAYSSTLTAASNGFINTAAMNISLYQNVYGNIWAALISGTYSGASTNNWGLTFSQGVSDTVNLTNGTWVDGKWKANVGGTVGGNTITGQAGGTYADGNFSGAGAGTFTQH